MAKSEVITFKAKGFDSACGMHLGDLVTVTQRALRPSASRDVHKSVRAKIMEMGFTYAGMRSLLVMLYDLSRGDHWRGEVDQSDTSEAKGYGFTKGTVKMAAWIGYRSCLSLLVDAQVSDAADRYRRVELLANRGHHLPPVYRRRALALGQHDLAAIISSATN